MKPFPLCLLLTITLLAADLDAAETPAASEGADPLAIAAVLIRNGDLSKADQVLASVDPAGKGTDLVRYHTLRGLLALKAGRAPESEAAFLAARDRGQKDPNLAALLAQAYFAQGKWAEVRRTLGTYSRLGAFPELLGMKAQAEWAQGDRGEAFETLERAIRNFPKQTSFLQTRLAWLLELNLDQEAAATAQEYLDRVGPLPQAWLAVGESLRRAGSLTQAIRFLEAGRLQFPAQAKIRAALSQAYLDQGLVRSAASLAQEAAALDPTWWVRASDMHRKARQWSQALYCNAQVSDPKVKARQRFTLLTDAGRYEEALASVDRLDQLGLLDQGRLRYAAAYAAFRVQDLPLARSLLAGATDPAVFGAAVQLRKAIETAAAETTLYF